MIPGTFVWYELATPDPRAAEAFYTRVVGWKAETAPMEGMAYTVLSAGPDMVGGLYGVGGHDCDGASKAGWVGYIGVDDVDAYATQIKRAGGSILRPPAEIPGVGRFAVASDPHGAVFMLFRGSGQAPTESAPGAPGHVGWNELHAGHGEKAFAFYSGLFGWTKAEALDMGPLGTYQLFAAGGKTQGGMMTKTPEIPAPFWLFYFNVETLDAAVKRSEEAGGKLLMGPHEVPGGSWIAHCQDPQGALFALAAPKR